MPTVIALDVSLSMSRPVLIPDCSEEYERRHLAVNGINSLLDFMTQNCKLEFFSLVVFSYLWDQLVTFTRDFDAIKAALNKIEIFNKTCIESVLTGIKALIADEWSTITPSQIILITDGNAGTGPGSLKHSLERAAKSPDEKFPLPFAFPCILNIVCLANPTDPDLQSSLPLYQKLVELSSFGGEVFVPETVLNMKSVQEMFLRLANRYYAPFYGNLHCGNMNCAVQLYPSPNSCLQNPTGCKPLLSNTLKICGFLDIADVSSPPTISRHLVLPVGTKEKENENEQKASKSDDADGLLDDGRIPAFTVLLHGSLKVESMVALTQVGEDWFGLMYSWADSKKKSNLILALFEQGLDTLTWLGNFDHLASMSEFSESPYGEDDSKTPFPVRPAEKHSYAQSCVVWIKPSGLQADLQKVLRHARKLPDKQQQFYKELNRIRRAALAFGFYELLEAMAAMLERECTMLPGTAHPSAAMQLTHAANALRSDSAKDVTVTVMPLQTNFSTEDG
ncbi:integrator complex subunit 14-like [Gigantopelta aegis]|uniref:integrator complex subunit 14-like n=1 Tax=Gigantopelta aegis TaxID=1735272 RepID=UPI001B887EA6|nr:integrator complex subunit 14-like [Gigantopelta aegis]